MKTLYYNPIELPSKVRLISNCLNIHAEYLADESTGLPIDFDELFNLAKCKSFDEVGVYLTSHEQAYIRANKTSKKEFVEGWLSLKGLRNGGGYLNDFGI